MELMLDPPAEELAPADPAGWFYVSLGLLPTATGLFLSWDHGWTFGPLAWAGGQVLVAVAFVQWFGILHECGHHTFFRSRLANVFFGHLAGFLALIPFACWQRVHALHHRWTGWQDRDPTTAGLARPHGRLDRLIARICWRCCIPIFSVVYRLANYWHLPRLRKFLAPGALRPMAINTLLLLLLYGGLIYILGAGTLLRLVGLGLVLGLIFQDGFLLGQHTHIPQNLAGDQKVEPFAYREQDVFTRSVLFPAWFSRYVLFGSDSHELHHMFPNIPGYHLRGMEVATENSISWWRFFREARRLPADVFLFENRNQTGLKL